jgi:hypothetical protein
MLGSGTGPVTVLGAATNGQIPIGSTGADPVIGGISGTVNQVNVANGAGSITLSTPQDIHSGATPVFAGMDLILQSDIIGLTVKGASGQTEDLLELIDNSSVNKFRVRAGGNIINVDGHITTAAQYGSGFWNWNFGDDTPEHTNQTGSYDHTGGAQEQLFTKTAGDNFTQADADNGNWILLTGTNVGAVSEIKEFIDASNVVVDGMGWNSDLASQTFQIFKHPSFVVGDANKIEISAGATGEFEVHSYDFTGRYMAEFELDSAVDGTDGVLIKAEANGYSSVQAFVLDYISGALGAGETGGGMAVLINTTEAVSADSTTEMDAYLAVIIDGSTATSTAYKVLPGFTNALQVQGATEIDPDYGYDIINSGSTVTNRVTGAPQAGTAFLDSSTSDITLFSTVLDYILIGNDDTFEIIEYTADTGSFASIVPTFEYSTGSGTWSTLTILADGTNGFQQSGQISFSAPGSWAKGDEAEAPADITSAYYVRITRTRVAALPVLPIEDHFMLYLNRTTGMKIDGKGFINPRVSADADAPNSSIYESTDSGVLVYKDSSGTVNDLY